MSMSSLPPDRALQAIALERVPEVEEFQTGHARGARLLQA
jgi:hypothetical protein